MRIRKELDEYDEATVSLATIADALGHPVRIALFKYVSNKNHVRNDVCNNDLVQNFEYSQGTISQHVKKLVDAGIFIVTKKDKFRFYSVNEKLLKNFTVQILKKS